MDIHFQPLSRTTMSRDIVQMIIDMINTGKLKPGAKLPSEREMMEQLQVSRSPVREALTSLSLVGVLETIPGDGTYVSKHLRDEMIFDQLEWSRLLTMPDIIELIEVRDPLEIQAAGLAALRATPESVGNLHRVVERYLSCGEDMQQAIEADRLFHQTITEMTQNHLLIQLMDLIWSVWRKNHEQGRLHFSVSRLLEQDYLEIVHAIEAGDEQRAREGMRRHLDHSRKISHAFDKNTAHQATDA
jgi:GntR family transcriptional repressor for pyruvate dehydrogenase complex